MTDKKSEPTQLKAAMQAKIDALNKLGGQLSEKLNEIAEPEPEDSDDGPSI